MSVFPVAQAMNSIDVTPGVASISPLVPVSSSLVKPSIGPGFQASRVSSSLAGRSKSPSDTITGRSFNVATSAQSPAAVGRDAGGNLVGSGILIDDVS